MADTVADNGFSAFFVRGKDRKPLSGLDLYIWGMVLEVNGSVASLGAGAACLSHPLNAAAWLARTLAGMGTALRAGDIVLTRALGPVATLKPGEARSERAESFVVAGVQKPADKRLFRSRFQQ